MKLIKKIIILSLFIYLLPIKVSAGSILFGDPEQISSDKYQFQLMIQDIDMNYIQGNIKVTNGSITNVTMSSGWINKTGNSTNFYFYRNGVSKGDYVIATFEITMTGNSEYSISGINQGVYKCKKDIYGNYFGENGKIVSLSTYNNTCGRIDDATLKSLSPSVGTLSPNFSSENYYYDLYVPNIASSVRFDVEATNKNASIIGKKCILTSNVTNCLIQITTEVGATKTYHITVYKENNNIPSTTFITNFKVHNGFLNKDFDINTTSYNVTPNKDAEYIYFSFKMNGTNYTTDKCSSDSANCKVTVTSGSMNRQYTFYIFNNNEETEKEEISNEIKIGNSKTSSSKSTTKSSNKKTTNKTTSKESEEKESKEVVQDEEKKEETIDPIEYNKENKKEDQKIEKNEKKNEIIVKETTNGKNDDKNNFLKILCIVNVFLGICIGLFFKKKK